MIDFYSYFGNIYLQPASTDKEIVAQEEQAFLTVLEVSCFAYFIKIVQF